MRKPFLVFVALSLAALGPFAVCSQTAQQNKKDPCHELRFMPLLHEAPTVSETDVHNLPQCFNGKFIRLVGIYRIAFENSDLYDPTGEGRSWVSFDPFHSAVKRCSAPAALKLFDRKEEGTFGFVAMGVFKSGGRYGHLNGWESEFQVICLEELKDFSESGSLFQFQTPKVQKRILDWYAKKSRE